MSELSRFTYSIVRVVPDPLRDEAINLGVIVIDETTGDVHGEFQRFTRALRARMRAVLPELNTDSIEEGVEILRSRLGSVAQLGFVDSFDTRIVSSQQLNSLAAELQNQLQTTAPLLYRGESIRAVSSELFALFVSPRRRAPVPNTHMTLRQLKTHIRRVIEKWGSEAVNVQQGLEQAGPASHYADFWVESGQPLAALIAIPDNPGEKFEAWARRDSIPTIAREFRKMNSSFRAVAVFPPNGKQPTTFVTETIELLLSFDNVLVLHADELDAHRDEIVPRLV